VDPNKYLIGIGQTEMAVASYSYDTVAMAANAADQLLTDEDREAIDMILFATESGVDQSKSAGTWVHRLLGIQSNARVVELKQACYSATASIQLAMGHIALHPESKVLVLASDIAKYGLETAGEPTQGAGAVAVLMSANPSILAIEKETGVYTEEISDFWRPNYSEVPFVDGKYSVSAYLDTLSASWAQYKSITKNDFSDLEAILFHVPYTKMGRKALKSLEDEMSVESSKRFEDYYESAIIYNKLVGNIYTGSLYLSLISLLEQSTELDSGSRIGMFSYGSGAVGEFFVGQLQKGYKNHLLKEEHEKLLKERKKLSLKEYEAILSKSSNLDEEGNQEDKESFVSENHFIFEGIAEGKRQYKKADIL
ncbi:MAG: hydroxymethylglutaryl-CoA synthase, partial [Atopostipes suicloacalis]|nr:hydroxymethylglutaryl-CoA synthase [Atopostipes suicloacalis]